MLPVLLSVIFKYHMKLYIVVAEGLWMIVCSVLHLWTRYFCSALQLAATSVWLWCENDRCNDLYIIVHTFYPWGEQEIQLSPRDARCCVSFESSSYGVGLATHKC